MLAEVRICCNASCSCYTGSKPCPGRPWQKIQPRIEQGAEPVTREQDIALIKQDWQANPRWKHLRRGYSAEDVYRLRGSVTIEHTIARRGAEKLWKLLQEQPLVNALGALTGNQAVQQVRA